MAPISSIAAIAARRAGSARIDRGSIGAADRFSATTKPVVSSSAPRTSTLPPPPDRFPAGNRGTRASMTAMTGGLIRNTARQPKYWVSSPPATIPAVAPAAVVACQIASARWRAAPSALVVVSSDSAAGEAIAPAAPCTIRAMISMIGHCASPQASDATPNRARPTAEQVRQAAARQQQRPERQRVPGDDPLQLRRGHAQLPLDRRQRHVHDAEVQLQHELGGADQRDDKHGPPRAARSGQRHGAILFGRVGADRMVDLPERHLCFLACPY